MRLTLIAAAAALPLAAPAAAVTSVLTPFTLVSANYTQNFDSLAATGTSSALPAGFQISETGTSATVDGLYTAGTGSSTAGDVYSFGATGSTERALGTVLSGSNSPSFGFIFNNGTVAPIGTLIFSFTGEQWRSVASADRLDFQYRVGATAIDSGTWTDFNALDILTLQNGTAGALDGNAAANRAFYTATISGLSIALGQSFGFRFVDFDTTGADAGLALDDLRIAALPIPLPDAPEPATWGLMIAGFAMAGVALRRRGAGLRLA